MAHFKVIAVTENKEAWLRAAADVYREKISHYSKCDLISIKPYKEARGATQEKIKKESAAILEKIDDRDYVILCDLKGKASSSEKFAERLGKTIDGGGSRKIVFLIGGAYGVDESLRTRANERLLLSEMTMNHYVAQVVLLEQIYRALTILKNIPYHNA